MPRPIPTTRPQEAGDLARRAVAEGADLVLVLGGDGTINEVLQGMVHSGVTMGILPGGTANVLAMELGFGTKLEKAAARLATCRPARIAVGRISTSTATAPSGPSASRFFLLMCGAGLDGQILSEVRGCLKAATGKVAFWVAGLSQFLHAVPALQANVNGETFSCGFALTSRVRNYGGDFELASGASLLREDFEVVLLSGSSPWRYAIYLIGAALGRVQTMRGVRTLHAQKVEIKTASPLQIDGEWVGQGTAVLEVVPEALTLLIPPEYK